MLFNSITFLLFLPAAVLLFLVTPIKYRVYNFIVFSILFYASWNVYFVFLIFLSASIDFYAGRFMGKSKDEKARKIVLTIAVSINLALLIFFKYINFLLMSYFDVANFLSSYSDLFQYRRSQTLDIILPLGISFYTFQTISYTVDCYRRVQKPISNYGVFFAYVSFWPQLIAGPILRAGEIIPQLINPVNPSRKMFLSGANRVLIGLAKKVLIADNIAVMSDAIFAMELGTIPHISPWVIWTGAFLFGFQIYFDFSAYSDIAVGSGRMLGIRFPENFNWPYLAKSPREFWQRWHISLSSWIRDYLYLPLLGVKSKERSTGGISVREDHGRLKPLLVLVVTWLIMGLWHGASWVFALWGLYHVAILLLYRVTKPIFWPFLSKFRIFGDFLAWALTLGAMMLGWLFFRSESVAQLMAFLSRLADVSAYGYIDTSRAVYYIAVIGILACMAASKVFLELERKTRNVYIFSAGQLFYLLVGTLAVSGIIALIRPVNQFIYFQF